MSSGLKNNTKRQEMVKIKHYRELPRAMTNSLEIFLALSS
jgi:hypothetical protein